MGFVHCSVMGHYYPFVRSFSFSSGKIFIKPNIFVSFSSRNYRLLSLYLYAFPRRRSTSLDIFVGHFLGVSSALLAAIQYAPQLLHTYRMKLVGALGIHMMLIQTSEGILMVISIALRKGTNWTSTFSILLGH